MAVERESYMGERTIYLLFTHTGTLLSRVINLYTKHPLNHVSIGFDKRLKDVYSFGRKRPRNPFIGGFVQEDIRSSFLRHSNCAVYTFQVTEREYHSILRMIRKIEAQQSHYRYNFIGLIGILLNIEIRRKHAFFCSQFVATILKEVQTFHIAKPFCFVTPEDIRKHIGMTLLYEGKLGDYDHEAIIAGEKRINREHKTNGKKRSIFLAFSQKVKQFVFR